MKYKKLTTFAICFLSINTFAAYHAINHDFHSSPGVHGGFTVTKDEIKDLPIEVKKTLQTQ